MSKKKDKVLPPLVNTPPAAPAAPVEPVTPVEPAATKNVKKVDEVAEFFKANPDAESVLKVGECLFLNTSTGAAKEYASRMQVEINEIENPKSPVGDSEKE